MPDISHSDALETLHALAPKCRVGDFICNHHEGLDELAAPAVGATWPEGVLAVGSDEDPAHPLDGIRRLLKMVDDAGIEAGFDEGQRASVGLVQASVGLHHAELARVRLVDVSPAMR